MASKTLRRLVADGQRYLYTTRWTHDLDGERVVSVALFHAESGREQHPRGKPIRANFLSREAEYPAASAVALPADVRAVLDQARALGWDGRRESWLLPACGLERPDLVLSTPTRLRAWAGESPMLVAQILEEGGNADLLARALGVPPVPEAGGAAEAAWRDDRRYLLRSRWGRYVSVYTRAVAEMVTVLTTLRACAPQLGASVSARSATLVISGDPPLSVVPPAEWAAHPGATRHRGLGESDVVWTLPDAAEPGIEVYENVAAEPGIEVYEYDDAAPDRLRYWTSLRDAGSVARRFPA